MKRGISCITGCKRCGAHETSLHALFRCHVVRPLWGKTCFSDLIVRYNGDRVPALLLLAADQLDEGELEIFFMLTWAVWKACNALVHENTMILIDRSIDSAFAWLHEFQSTKSPPTPPVDNSHGSMKWEPCQLPKHECRCVGFL